MTRCSLFLCFFFLVLLPDFRSTVSSQPIDDQARRLLQKFQREPNVQELHQFALQYALVGQDRIAGMISRAQGAAWLPEFRFRYQRNVDDRRLTAFPTSTTPILTTQTANLDHRFEFRATWNLNELVFNRNEIVIYRELRRLVELRTDVLKEVTKLYYERRRLQLEMILKPASSLLARLRQMLRLQELAADLDALTGTGFSRLMKERGIALDAVPAP